MFRILHDFFRRGYEPLNRIEISASALRHNYRLLSGIDRNLKVAPVLKSNAYGHGLTLVARVLDSLNPPFLCVDSLYEAYELMKIHIKSPILVMGSVSPKSLKTKRLPFSFAVCTKEMLDGLTAYQPHAGIHIFVDTGMHREGIPVSDLSGFLRHIKTKTSLAVTGLMSHFGKSDEPDNPITQQQVKQFQEAQEVMRYRNIHPRWIHTANSSGLLNAREYKGNLGNVARAGIALYGIDPEGKNTRLKPALEVKTYISQVKSLKKGQSLGYDFTFKATGNMTTAVLPMGYNDGIDRRLSNIGYVSVNGKNCQIIGRVSMNITTIDLSASPISTVGQEVTVYSNKTRNKNSILNAANLCRTIPYELLVHLTPTTKRILVP